MTPTGPVPDLPEAEPQPQLQQQDPAEVLRKRVYMGFAAIVAFGFGLSGLYVAGRLFAYPKVPNEVAQAAKPAPKPVPQPGVPKPSPLESARQSKSAPAPAAAPVKSVQQLAPTPVPAPNPVQVKAQPPAPVADTPAKPSPTPARAALITPKEGERYLQLAALPMGLANKYVAELDEKGVHASIAGGPSEELYRVLVGPFPDRAAVERQRDALQAAGIENIWRVY